MTMAPKHMKTRENLPVMMQCYCISTGPNPISFLAKGDYYV